MKKKKKARPPYAGVRVTCHKCRRRRTVPPETAPATIEGRKTRYVCEPCIDDAHTARLVADLAGRACAGRFSVRAWDEADGAVRYGCVVSFDSHAEASGLADAIREVSRRLRAKENRRAYSD